MGTTMQEVVTASTTSKALVKTAFTAQLTLSSPNDFDLEEYRKALASISGADVDNIEVVSVSFAAQAQYKFAEVVTKANVDAAVAKTLAIPQEKVNAQISDSSARRLRAEKERRRLGETIVDVTVDVSGTDGLNSAKAAASSALAGLKDTAALISELGVSGLELVSSGVLVTVQTEMLSSASGAELALDASALGEKLGAEVKITETSGASTSGASTSTTTDAEERSAAAPKEALVTPLVLLAVACFNFLM